MRNLLVVALGNSRNCFRSPLRKIREPTMAVAYQLDELSIRRSCLAGHFTDYELHLFAAAKRLCRDSDACHLIFCLGDVDAECRRKCRPIE